jgi:hypothetical protein
MEGTRKIGRQRGRWGDEVEKNLCTLGTKNMQTVFRDCLECINIVLRADVYKGL